MLRPEGLPSHYQWPPFPRHIRLLTALHVRLLIDGSVGGLLARCWRRSALLSVRSDLCRYDPFCCV